LRRERLLDALVRAPHRLLLVTGPAGCGKTTLLTQFVQAVQDTGPVVWYRLDGGDARASVLLRHLAHALGGVVGGLGGGWESVEEAVADLEEADVSARPVVLALDDLHVLAGTAAEDALGQVLELAPPWLRVAATCRQPPAWNLPRLRVSGALFEIGADDLRFRSWEVERLFTELYREPLPPGDLAQLTRGLEGWGAGLQMFHLATRGKPVTARRRAVASLPARSKLIREYLTGNVLDELPDDLRRFLLDTSVFGRLSPRLGDELRGRDDSARLLNELEARQVFVDRLDDGTFRYHEVFRTYLDGRLVERDGQVEARARSRRAAELLEAEGLMLEALRAYCRAEDWAAVARVLDTAGAELVEDSVSWLDWLPPGLIEDDPWAMLAAARRAVATGRFARALDLYARAEKVPGAASAGELCRRERAGIAGWVDPAASPPEGWNGRLRAALRARPAELAVLAPTPEGPDDEDHAGPVLAAGVASLLAGDLGTARRWLTPLVEDPEAGVALVAAAQVALAIARLLGGAGGTGAAGGVGSVGGVGGVGINGAGGAHDDVVVASNGNGSGRRNGNGSATGVAASSAVTVDELPELVEVADAPYLSWVARAVRGLDGSAEGWRQAHDAADALDRQGTSWGSAAARLFAVLGSVVSGGSPIAEIDDLCARLRALDAAVPEAWCLAWRATALARHVVAPAAAEAAAMTAAEVAARVGVPGAQVWALTVQAQLALATGNGESATAHLERAATVRRVCQVDVVVPPLHAPPFGSTAPALLVHPLDEVTSAHVLELDVAAGNGNGAGAGESPLSPPTSSPPSSPPWSPPLRVQVFGGLSLEVEGRKVELRNAKPRVRAALRLLAASAGRPVHVETLIEALWPDGDPTAGKRNLQVALSSVRRLLDQHHTGAGALVTRDGDAYLLALPDGAQADVVDFAAARDEARAAARHGDAAAAVAVGERALDLYRGELLPEEGPADWVVQLRRNLAQDAADVALLVADHAITLGRWEAAVSACSRGLDIDRYSDGLWRLLAVAHERGGDLAAAAQAQERYRLVLEDLGMAAS
jgi:DNA-binding SARP family transcriptional activator